MLEAVASCEVKSATERYTVRNILPTPENCLKIGPETVKNPMIVFVFRVKVVVFGTFWCKR